LILLIVEPIETPWTDDLDHSKHVNIQCPQTDLFLENTGTVLGQEDCLVLNVYTPKKSFEKTGFIRLYIISYTFKTIKKF